jgi:dynein light chain 1, axonemal
VTGVHCSCQIEKLDDVAGTLEELWISYNQINSLDGVNILTNLSVLYMSNNLIKSWSELDKLVSLQILSEVFVVLMSGIFVAGWTP